MDKKGFGEDEKDEEHEVESKLDTGKIRRKLISLDNDKMILELSVKIRVLQNAWTAKYVFALEPVSLDRLDILEARLRDVEDELEETKENLEKETQEREKAIAELNKLKQKLAAMKTVVYLKATSKNVAQLNDKGHIVWSSFDGKRFQLSKNTCGIRFLVTGWYVISVFLSSQSAGTSVEHRLNGKYFHSQLAPLNAKQNASVAFTTTAFFTKDDEIMLVATGSPLKVGADLGAFKIGN